MHLSIVENERRMIPRSDIVNDERSTEALYCVKLTSKANKPLNFPYDQIPRELGTLGAMFVSINTVRKDSVD